MSRRLKHVAGPLLGVMALIYFVYHTVQGDRGLIAWLQLNHQIHEAETTLSDLRLEQTTLRHQATLLRPDDIDPDMLEERARTMLDLGHPDDIVVFRPKS